MASPPAFKVLHVFSGGPWQGSVASTKGCQKRASDIHLFNQKLQLVEATLEECNEVTFVWKGGQIFFSACCAEERQAKAAAELLEIDGGEKGAKLARKSPKRASKAAKAKTASTLTLLGPALEQEPAAEQPKETAAASGEGCDASGTKAAEAPPAAAPAQPTEAAAAEHIEAAGASVLSGAGDATEPGNPKQAADDQVEPAPKHVEEIDAPCSTTGRN